MKKMITNGQANGIIILAAEKMGYNISFKEQAVMLCQKDSIEPIYMGIVDEEAVRLNNLIAKDKRTNEANNIALKMLN